MPPAGSALIQYWSRQIGFVPQGIVGDGSTDNTAAIQAALDAAAAAGGGVVRITDPGTYMVGGLTAKTMTFSTGITYRTALTIASKCGLYLGEGVVLALSTNANKCLLGNSDPVGRNSDIGIFGEGEIRVSTAQGIDNTGPEYWPGHIVVLVGIDRLYVGGGLRFNTPSTTIKYAIETSDITDSVFKHLIFDECYSDNLHIEQCDRVMVEDIVIKPVSGHGDNLAIGPSNGGVSSYYPEIVGANDTTPRYARNVTIRNVMLNGAYQAIRLFGRVTDTIDNILIDGVYGTVANGVVISLADDPNGSGELVGCRMSNIRLANIHATPSAGNKTVGITARNVTDVTIDGGSLNSGVSANVGLVMVNQGSSAFPVAFTAASWTNGTLTLTKTGAFARTVITPSTVVIVTSGTSTTAGTYRVVSKTSDDAVVLDRTIGAAASSVSFIICNLAEVNVNGINVRDGIIGKFVEVAANSSGYGAAVQKISVTNSAVKLGFDGASTFGRVYSTGYADNLALATVWNNVTVDGVYISGTAPNSVQAWDFGPTTFLTYHIVSGLNVRGLGSSSIVFRNQGTTTTLDASDWTIANIGGNVFQVSTGSTNFRVRGTGGYTAIGSFTPTFCAGSSQVLSIDWPNFQCDARKIKPTIGDRVYNTNATAAQVAAGVGPVRAVATQSASGEYSGTPTDPWSADTVYRRQSTKTADYTIVVGETGTAFNTDGASGTVVFTLPAATVGQWYTFRCGSANAIRVDPNGSETIALPSTGVQDAAGKYMTTSTNGPTMHIACDKAGQWSVYGYTGTWTAEP